MNFTINCCSLFDDSLYFFAMLFCARLFVVVSPCAFCVDDGNNGCFMSAALNLSGENSVCRRMCGLLLHVEEVWALWFLCTANQTWKKEIQPSPWCHVSFYFIFFFPPVALAKWTRTVDVDDQVQRPEQQYKRAKTVHQQNIHSASFFFPPHIWCYSLILKFKRIYSPHLQILQTKHYKENVKNDLWRDRKMVAQSHYPARWNLTAAAKMNGICPIAAVGSL